MAKIIEFNFYTEIGGYLPEDDSEDNIDYSGDYVSLANYQKLEALLKRWNEISPDLADEYNYANQSPELKQLIQDTRATFSSTPLQS